MSMSNVPVATPVSSQATPRAPAPTSDGTSEAAPQLDPPASIGEPMSAPRPTNSI